MGYPSIDTLQKVLSEQVFSHAKDAKKAAGRALGTLIEIISFHLLKEWGMNESISIERGLPEYGNPEITHNVEFTLHPLFEKRQIIIKGTGNITAAKILKQLAPDVNVSPKSNVLLTSGRTLLRNACSIAETESLIILASVNGMTSEETFVDVYWQHKKPYAMFECKRVGVEEGNKKGPQTIEKAKQGAYVAKMTSSLQKIRNEGGEMYGIIYENGRPVIQPYAQLLQTIIEGENTRLLKDFTLSVGIVSNHGNWFTSDNQNKELKVLAQSYDWLLFLSDTGLAQFISELLLNPKPEYQAVQKAFLDSYKEGKKSNVFTKVRMDYDAHRVLEAYFHTHIVDIERWFNVITPKQGTMALLKKELENLKQKDWNSIL